MRNWVKNICLLTRYSRLFLSYPLWLIFLNDFVQNPFLYGCYTLRKEQLKMQLAAVSSAGGRKMSKADTAADAAIDAKALNATVKERTLYYPTTFSGLELIVRSA